jgi:hypothetical protein
MSNSRAKTMKAIMSHPGSMKMLRDAIKSPIGSTSRSQAQKIFRIMDKLYTANDGVGGPGMRMQQQQDALQSLSAPNNTFKDPQGIIVFHKLPPMKIDFSGKKKKTVYGGMGGPGFDGEGGIGDWLSGALDAFKSAIGINNTASAAASTPVATSSNLGMSSANPFINTPSYTPTPLTLPRAASPVITPNVPATTSNSSNSSYLPGLFSLESLYNLGAGASNNIINPITSGLTRLGNYVGSNVASGLANFGSNASDLLFGRDANKVKSSSPYKSWSSSGVTLPNSPYKVTVLNPSGVTPSVPKSVSTALASVPNYNSVGTSQGFSNTQTNPAFTPTATATGQSYGPENPNKNWSNIVNNINPNAERIASAIKQVESGGDYNAKGASGESGAYQFMPGTWAQYSKEYKDATGDDASLQTPGNEDKVATWKINQWLGQGYKADQIAALWNWTAGGGSYLGHVGVNDSGVAYNTPAYVGKVMSALTGETASYAGGATGGDSDISDILGGYSLGGINEQGGLSPVSYTGALGQFSPSGIYNAAKSAVASNIGGTAFANAVINDPDNPETSGLSMSEAMAKNESDLWSKFDIDVLQKEQIALRKAKTLLNDKVSANINGRDEYLNQTNDMIKAYVAETKNKPMSDSEAAQAANHLNYLYTLRGMQNRSYMQYMEQAVTENEAELQNVTDTLSMNLSNLDRLLKSKNMITEDRYKTMANDFAGMYNSLEGAETKALQTQLLKYQVLDAYKTAVTDPVKLDVQSGYIEQSKKLDGHITKDGLLMPGVDLIDSLQKFYSLDPTIGQGNIIAAYTDGVNNVLNAPADTKIGDTKIDDNYKINVGKSALEDFGQYTASAYQTGADGKLSVSAGNTSTYNNGLANAQQISKVLAGQISKKLSSTDTIKKIVEVIKSLNATGWFSHKPSKAEFINNMVKKTGGAVDNDIASAIYDDYLEQTQAGDSDADYINSTLYDLRSTENRTGTGDTTGGKVAFSDSQLAYNIAELYCNRIFYNALSSATSQSQQAGTTTSM